MTTFFFQPGEDGTQGCGTTSPVSDPHEEAQKPPIRTSFPARLDRQDARTPTSPDVHQL